MKIKVAKEDIKRGVRFSGLSCPIAIALKRVRGMEEADVTSTRIWFGHEHLNLPILAKQFIERFDAGKRVEPIEFEI